MRKSSIFIRFISFRNNPILPFNKMWKYSWATAVCLNRNTLQRDAYLLSNSFACLSFLCRSVVLYVALVRLDINCQWNTLLLRVNRNYRKYLPRTQNAGYSAAFHLEFDTTMFFHSSFPICGKAVLLSPHGSIRPFWCQSLPTFAETNPADFIWKNRNLPRPLQVHKFAGTYPLFQETRVKWDFFRNQASPSSQPWSAPRVHGISSPQP